MEDLSYFIRVNMNGLSFSPFPDLSTGRSVLRQLRPTDCKEIMGLRSDERILQFLVISKCNNLFEANQFIEKINTGIKNNEWIYWGITEKGADTLIGTICLWNISKENFRAEIGYVLHPDFHRKGIMSKAIDAVMDYGFNKMNLHSVEAHVHPDNKASIKLLETKGFMKEAHFKENVFFEGKFLDTVIYSCINNRK